jgi:hypothetical protein
MRLHYDPGSVGSLSITQYNIIERRSLRDNGWRSYGGPRLDARRVKTQLEPPPFSTERQI